MNINDIEKRLELFEDVQYRMGAEGFHYCFECYSSFTDIKDKKFHKLRLAYLTVAKDLENYVNDVVDKLTDQHDELLTNLLDSEE